DAAVASERAVARSDFEQWIAPEIGAITSCVDRLLANCSVAARDVDAIFMTGGSSFVPAIRAIFEKKFPRAAVRAGQEFTSVAEGLALHALAMQS
ncbi:MAG TPA: Hsp70 family protein, partial [Candidatus Binatia bacterium]|nr:Hsp70 family protein [Candidatus Binatia bacterium]